MKKFLSLMMTFLVVFMSVFALMACEDESQGGEGTTSSSTALKFDHDTEATTVSTTSATTSSTTEGPVSPSVPAPDDSSLYEDIPTGNYGGYTFKILNNISNYANTTIVPTDMYDSVSSAMYNRNAYVKDKLNIKLQEVSMSYNDVAEEMRKITSSNDFVYDAVYNEVVFQTLLAQNGAYYSVEEYEQYLNFEKPWWFTDAMDSIRIDGRGFELFGDLQLMYYDSIWAMVFNQKILSDNKQAYPYELVRSGDWTIDALKNIIAATATTGSENWGMLSHKDFISAMICASDFELVSQDEDDILVRFNDNETFNAVYGKIMNVFFTSNGETNKVNYIIADNNSNAYKSNFTHVASNDYGWDFQYLFTIGKGSFMAGTVGDIQMIRGAEFNYGIIPLPKYTTDQEQYVSWIYKGAASCGIPATNPDLERTCTILENLAAYSYKLVKREYYDVVVQTRTIRDNDSIEMLDIIFGHDEKSTTRFEIDTVYKIGISEVIRKEMSDRSTNVMSAFGNFIEINANINKVIEAYKG